MRKTAFSGSLDETHRPVFLKSKDATEGSIHGRMEVVGLPGQH